MKHFLAPVLFALTFSSVASSQEEMRPFKDGESATFQVGVFNDVLAQRALRDLPRIVSFGGKGHVGGVRTWSFSEKEGQLLLVETYDYPEEADRPASDEMKEAEPPSSLTYEVGSVTVSGTEIQRFKTTLGTTPTHIFLLPVMPKEGMEWVWKTGEDTFQMGKLTSSLEGDGYNASAKVVSTKAEADGAIKRYTSLVQIEVTVEGVTATFWFDANDGLIRFGGDNVGLSRELLAIEGEDPENPGKDIPLPMNQVVNFRQ